MESIHYFALHLHSHLVEQKRLIFEIRLVREISQSFDLQGRSLPDKMTIKSAIA